MLFNSVQFAIFFLATLGLVRALPRRATAPVLLAASLVFYGLWIPSYLVLLLADLGANYALLRLMLRSRRPGLYLAAASVVTLGLLAYFKYAAFLVGTALPLLSTGSIELSVPEIFLPLGISFYSFQILALTVDVYRGHIEAPRSFARYSLFVCFFPQIIAGPILRGHEFLPQLERGPERSIERNRRGLWLIAAGLVKKVVFADFLLAPFVDAVFAEPGAGTGPILLLAVYGFAFQIYFDFSGYADMARGMALLIGFELPMNFTEPYLSRSPAEFWRRWHRTLSQWLRDYLYIPLGGNRRGGARTLVNLMLTMLLGGLWHGASWTFVVWGGLHGAWLVAHRLLPGRRAARTDSDDDAVPLSLRDLPRLLGTFHGAAFLFAVFRAPDLAVAGEVIGGVLGGGYLGPWPVLQTGITLLCVAAHVFERKVRLALPLIHARLAGRAWAPLVEGAAFGAVLALTVAASGSGAEFIYFQF